MSVPDASDAQARRDRERALFLELAHARDQHDGLEIQRIRDELIVMHLGLVRHVARRVYGGAPPDDLIQAGTVGLIQAVDGFDPHHGAEFSSYAVRWIQGAQRELIRGHAWPVAVPRRLKDLHASVRAERSRQQAAGRSPTVDDLADALGASVGDVIEALSLDDVRSTSSIDAPSADRTTSVAESLGTVDDGFGLVELRADMAQAIAALPDDERRALIGCVVESRTQSDVAAELGTNQARVSRLVDRARVRLRATLATDAPVNDDQ